MGRTQKRGLSFLRKLKPGSLEKRDTESEVTLPSPIKKSLETTSNVNQKEVTMLLKGLGNMDLGSGPPARPPRRSDKRNSSSSNSSQSANTTCANSDSPKSSVSGDDVFSPGFCNLSKSSVKSVSFEESNSASSPTLGRIPKGQIFFSPVKGSSFDSPSQSNKPLMSPTQKAELAVCQSKSEPASPNRSVPPCKGSSSKVILIRQAAVCKSEPKPDQAENSDKPSGKERVELQVRLMPAMPVPPVRKIRIRTCATSAPGKSPEGKSGTVLPNNGPLKAARLSEEEQAPPKIVVDKTVGDDEEDEGIFSIEDVEVDDLTRTDKAVLLRKKFSQLKVKNHALKAKDMEIQERFAMLQSKRNRMSSVVKRSSRNIRSSLIGS